MFSKDIVTMCDYNKMVEKTLEFQRDLQNQIDILTKLTNLTQCFNNENTESKSFQVSPESLTEEDQNDYSKVPTSSYKKNTRSRKQIEAYRKNFANRWKNKNKVTSKMNTIYDKMF